MHRLGVGCVKMVQECEGPAGGWTTALGFYLCASTAEYPWVRDPSGKLGVFLHVPV